MSESWNNIKTVCCKPWLVLPTVYSDALSYGEQLDKFCYSLNKIIENNNMLPEYIAEKIKEYISSGAISEVVREILANYILNVKYPPKGITPAVGDGSADDTEAVQGCIDYAAENGGVVYFPYGSYLTQPLTMKSGVSLFGFDRYSTKIVLKGGATKALLNGNGNNLSVCNLTLDGNSGIQVNDVNVVDMTGSNLMFNDLVIKDGYKLFNFVGDGHLQLSNIVFGNAVENCFTVDGNVIVQTNNLLFTALSKVGGVSVVDIRANGGNYDFNSVAKCDTCMLISGNDNEVVAVIGGANEDYVDTGEHNNVEIVGHSQKKYYSGNVKKDANNSETTLQGTRSLHVVGSNTVAYDSDSTESVDGNKSSIVTGTTTETYKGDRNVTDENKTENVKKKVVNATDIVLLPTNPLTYGEVQEDSPFNYVYYRDKNNSLYKSLVAKGDIIDSLPVLDVTKFGVLPNGEDMTAKLNALIETYFEKFTIYMRKGIYTFNGTIIINGYGTKLVCDGEIHSTANTAINVLANGVELYVNKITGINISNSIGLLIGGELNYSIGNGNFTVPTIDKFNTGILLKGNHGFGVQNNNFFLTRIDHFKIGIGIECGDGNSWVNENRFYNGWMFGYEGNSGTEIGVKFTKGTEQTDPFNGNRFINFSCEGCATMFELHFAHRNSFVDFRMIEQTGDKQIVCGDDSADNMFSSVNAQTDYKMIKDTGINNIYKMRFYSENQVLCSMGTFAFGVFMPVDSDMIFSRTNYIFNNKGGYVPGSNPLRYMTISNSTSNKITIVLPLCVNYPSVMNQEFTIETGDIDGGVTILCYGGQVFCDTDTNVTTLIGYHLEAWTKYIVRCIDVLTWKVVPVLPFPRVPTGVTTTANGIVTETQQAVTITANSSLTY